MATILVVDDDPHIREVICFALTKEGFRVLQAEDGREALDQFTAHTPDLVVLDILMPEMNGTDVCRELRRDSTTPIVFLSSKDEELDRILGLELGGDDYVTKPFSPRELVARGGPCCGVTSAVVPRRFLAYPRCSTAGGFQCMLNTSKSIGTRRRSF